MEATDGNVEDTASLIKAMEGATFADSPRGAWSMSKNHNPIQDFYLRQVKDGRNEVIGMAAKAVEDPGSGCKL